MAHSHTSTPSSGRSAWSIINVLLAAAFAVFTLCFGGAFVVYGIAAASAKRAPKEAAKPAAPAPASTSTPAGGTAAGPSAAIGATAAPAAVLAAPSGPVQQLDLTPDAVNPMAYSTKSFSVKVGQPVKLTFANKAALPLPHNVVVGKAGSKDVLMAAATRIMMDPQGMAKNYVPDDCPDIIAHTKLVQPGQSETIEFSCPVAGEYPYMCMFPGHTIMMNGIIKAE